MPVRSQLEIGVVGKEEEGEASVFSVEDGDADVMMCCGREVPEDG